MGDSASLQDIYAKNLEQSYGFPLRIPEPSSSLPELYHEGGLQIGDVGFVSGDGKFNVIFNIRYSSNHILHRRGVPDGFEPVNLDSEGIGVTRNAIPPDCVISSPRTNRVLQPRDDPSVTYEFFPSTSTGAILILPFGAIRHDLEDKEEFRRAAMKQGLSWCTFAGRDSLYLITGFYKASAWTLGSFRDAPGNNKRQIQVVKRNDDAGMYKWNYTCQVDWREGPEDRTCTRHNQTIFMNGFKITVRPWARDPQIQLMPHTRRSLFIRAYQSLSLTLLELSCTSSIRVKHEPRLSEPFHPSDGFNRFLLEKDPDAQIAVTHDNQWTRMIEQKELTYDILGREEDLVTYLSAHYSDCVASGEQDGVVYLRSKRNMAVIRRPRPRKVVTRELPRVITGFSLPPPSHDKLESSVTRIRAENIIAGLERVPAGFFVVFQFAGTKRRTKAKPILVHESVIEWDDEILLPSDPSVSIDVTICASFELSQTLGNGETLHRLKTTMGDLICNTKPLDVFPREGQVKPWCSSILIAAGPRRFNRIGIAPDISLVGEESSELARVTDLGQDAFLRYQRGYKRDDLDLSISHFKRAFDICTDVHPCRAAVLFNRAKAECIARQVDGLNLADPISLYRGALELRPVGCPDRPATQLHLAQALLYRYMKQGREPSVASEVEQLVTELQSICDINTHERRAIDLVLQTYKTYKLVHSGNLAEIDSLIPELTVTTQIPPQGHFDRPTRLNNASLALLRRFELLVNVTDGSEVEQAVSYLEEALGSTSDDNPNKPSYLYNIGMCLFTRFNRIGKSGDLDRAIASFEDVLRINPSSDPDRYTHTNSLGRSYLTRYNHFGDSGDLDRAIVQFTDVATLVPTDHPDRHTYLDVLGDCFLTRFERAKEPGDLDQSISLLEGALQLTPHGHPDKPNHLHSLGNRLFSRYENQHGVPDLVQAVARLEGAVQLTDEGDPHHTSWLNDLLRMKQVLQNEHGVSSESKPTLGGELDGIKSPHSDSFPVNLPSSSHHSPAVHSRTAFYDDPEFSGAETEDDDDDWDDDIRGEFDLITERNTEQNAQIIFVESDGHLLREDDGGGDPGMEPDPLGEGVNIVLPREPHFPSLNPDRTNLSSREDKRGTAKRKKLNNIQVLPLATSRPLFQRDRCTITVTQGTPDASGRRKKTYVVASDLSEESKYAVEWGIGTVLRDGDEMLIVTVAENKDKIDSTVPNPEDRTTKLRNQQERQGLAYILVRQATSLLQRTMLHVTVSCQAWHAKNARHMLLDIVDYNEPTMLIVGSRGLGQVKGIRLGSTSNYLIQRCSVPVMVARRRLKRPPKRSAHLAKHRVHVTLAESGIDRVVSKLDHYVASMRDEMERDDDPGSTYGSRGIDDEEDVEGEGEVEAEETMDDGDESEVTSANATSALSPRNQMETVSSGPAVPGETGVWKLDVVVEEEPEGEGEISLPG